MADILGGEKKRIKRFTHENPENENINHTSVEFGCSTLSSSSIIISLS